MMWWHFFVGFAAGWIVCNLTWYERKTREAEAAIHASLDRIESALGVDPPDGGHARVMKFYGVTTVDALIEAQAHHVEKLQAKLPATPPLAPQRVREA